MMPVTSLQTHMQVLMNETKKHPLLNRKETQTTLNTIKVITTAGAISMTVAGWGLLALIDARNAQAASSVAIAAPPAQPSNTLNNAPSNVPAAPTPTPQTANQLDIVQWVQDNAGDQVAVVRDSRGTLWYVMGSDVPRIEAGQQPVYQPIPVRTTTRSRAS
jgi:hypothetical protein